MHPPGKAIALIACLAIASLLSGCSNTYTIERLPLETSNAEAGAALPPLTSGDPVLVSEPADGRYGSRTYVGSGIMVQLAVVSCLEENGLDAVAKAAGNGSGATTNGWRVVPTILGWEDRATEWSGLPDRIKIELRTIDPAGRPRDATIISGSSKWATLGGDHPQDMLAPALAPWASELLKSLAPPNK